MWNKGDFYLNDINWVLTLEEEGYLLMTSDIELVIMTDDEEERYESAGAIDVRIFGEQFGDMMYYADVDGDSYAIMDTYMESNKDYERVAVLNSITIKEEYQRIGIASYVIHQLHHFLREVLNVDGVVLIASPGNDSERQKEKIEWLIGFYEQFGYRPLIGGRGNHLGLDLVSRE